MPDRKMIPGRTRSLLPVYLRLCALCTALAHGLASNPCHPVFAASNPSHPVEASTDDAMGGPTMPTPTRRLTPFAVGDVRFTDGFWSAWQETNRRVTIPHIYRMCVETGRIGAFKLDWKPGDPNPPHIFWDSDVAKWTEAASYAVAAGEDGEIRKMLDEVSGLIVGAQQPDGYLNTHYTVVEPDKLWSNLRDRHELYCAGHLMEAAVAHHEATGSRELLDALCRYADYIDSVFGPGKRTGYPGHEEIELALIKLYRATGEKRYLELCRYFVDERGKQPHFFDAEAKARGEDPSQFRQGRYEYNQSHVPVREQSEAVGHAVRAMYLYSGMADLAAETGDAELLAACRRLWENTVLKKMYVTGGVGALGQGEAFGTDYHLPNESAYAETCAAIGLVFFSHRMLQIEADGRYADAMERALYNGALSGLSLSGDRFFYVNPLESAGGHHRQEFYNCSCCPPNISRLIASLGTYAYSAAEDAVYVHLYAAGVGKTQIGGRTVTIAQQTDYPWAGEVEIIVGVAEATEFALMLRIPGWCGKYTLKVNGRATSADVAKRYAAIRRRWRTGDRVELGLAMPVERIVSHPQVHENVGRVALQRGPMVYCLEQCDHSADVRSIILPDRAKLKDRFDKDLLGGAVVIEGEGMAPELAAWDGSLYRPEGEVVWKPTPIKAIPYCLWDNREPGAMTVWVARN